MNRYTRAIALHLFVPDMLLQIVDEWDDATILAVGEWVDAQQEEHGGLPEVEAALQAAHRGEFADLPDVAIHAVWRISLRNRDKRPPKRLAAFTATERSPILDEVIRRALLWKADQV